MKSESNSYLLVVYRFGLIFVLLFGASIAGVVLDMVTGCKLESLDSSGTLELEDQRRSRTPVEPTDFDVNNKRKLRRSNSMRRGTSSTSASNGTLGMKEG